MTEATHNYNFDSLGFTPRVEGEYVQIRNDFGLCSTDDLTVEPARVVKVDRGFPLVAAESGTYRSELSQRLAKRARKHALERPAVGDWVILSHPPGHEFGIVEAFLPRFSSLKRRDPLERKSSGRPQDADPVGQVVVANIDLIFVVQALSAESCSINLARLERELVLAYESGAEPMVVLTKADLCGDPEAARAFAIPVVADTPIIIESAVTGRGIARIRSLIKPGVTAALIGASGVGKSTMINRLLGIERQQTGQVREKDERGRHVTVARELIELPLHITDEGPSGGGAIIDTPGMRSLALWQADYGLTRVFPEITTAADACKFSDCSHENEPKCGVKAAIESGTIDKARYHRYLTLTHELTNP